MGLFSKLAGDLVVTAEHGIQFLESETGKIGKFFKKETGETVTILENGYRIAAEDFDELDDDLKEALSQFVTQAKHNWTIVPAPAPGTSVDAPPASAAPAAATEAVPAAPEGTAVQQPPPSQPESPDSAVPPAAPANP